ncbi:MAG: GTP-binding protein, partial [Solobacterium sp.]|nr:GTP-binding protein [Solobacterium sp.]
MTKVNVISGFLGAGKTTLIAKLLKDVFQGEQVVLVENEFGEIGIDGGFLKEAGIQINEINSGCICCTLKGDFEAALHQVVETYHPDRILIEPSGVGKLSDILRAIRTVEGLEIDSYSTVVDAARCQIYHKNFKEFFDDQIATATCVILSRTQNVDAAKLEADMAIIRELNPEARVITTPWDELDGTIIFDAMTGSTDGFPADLGEDEDEDEEEEEHEHHHHHHDDDEECECHHHHDDDEECECHHHHDDDDEECECHHHHDDDEECECHHHHHDDDEEHEHHHHKHADPNEGLSEGNRIYLGEDE